VNDSVGSSMAVNGGGGNGLELGITGTLVDGGVGMVFSGGR
jgi:hypothetical protein